MSGMAWERSRPKRAGSPSQLPCPFCRCWPAPWKLGPVEISPSSLANVASRLLRNRSATYSAMPAARRTCQARHTVCARSRRLERRTTARPLRSSRPSSDGRAAPSHLIIRGLRIASGLLSMRSRTMIEHLFPHLMGRCGKETRKTNEINGKKYRWWAREDSNLQPDRYEHTSKGWPNSGALGSSGRSAVIPAPPCSDRSPFVRHLVRSSRRLLAGSAPLDPQLLCRTIASCTRQAGPGFYARRRLLRSV
jgi:hypothetical protein